jgi:hypothetical protein
VPVKSLPPDSSLDRLEYQARELLAAHAEYDLQAAQRIREFHPRFDKATDTEIFTAPLSSGDAELTIARERGFSDWPRLKRRIEAPTLADDLTLRAHERIEDALFRGAVGLLDAGDAEGLRLHLKAHPGLIRQHVTLEGGNYFRNPTLLEFVAENPIRHGVLPANITEVAKLILDAGAQADQVAVDATLGLVCSGCVPRQCGVQIPLIDLLCEHGADPARAMPPALAHGEFEAVNALIRNSAPIDLPAAAALGRSEESRRLLTMATDEERHRAFALAAQFGHTEIVRLLLDFGEDPNRYNPVGNHGHSTPLHQAVAGGHEDVVRLLVERGARLDLKDTLWQGTPLGWAIHEGKSGIAEYLRTRGD